MAVDFDALDLVRTKNKAKVYEQKKREQLLKKVDDIKQKLLKPIFNGCNDEFYEMWLNKAHKYYNDNLFKKQMNKQLQQNLSVRELTKILFNTLKDENGLAIRMIVRNYNNKQKMKEVKNDTKSIRKLGTNG